MESILHAALQCNILKQQDTCWNTTLETDLANVKAGRWRNAQRSTVAVNVIQYDIAHGGPSVWRGQ